MLTQTDKFRDIRDAVRALCAEFPAEYFRNIDQQRGYPEQFVDALTQAGWLAALIPQGIRRFRPGLDRSLGDHGGNQPLGRQFGRFPAVAPGCCRLLHA